MRDATDEIKSTEPDSGDVERVPLGEVRDRLTDMVNRIRYRGERFILTRNGEDVAYVIGIKDTAA